MTPNNLELLADCLEAGLMEDEMRRWASDLRAHAKAVRRSILIEPCNCGLHEFLSRPRDFIESFKQRISELTAQLEEARESYRTLEPCGHAKNFQIGDEHGKFTCTVCRIAELTRMLAASESLRQFTITKTETSILALARMREAVERTSSDFDVWWESIGRHIGPSKVLASEAFHAGKRGHKAPA